MHQSLRSNTDFRTLPPYIGSNMIIALAGEVAEDRPGGLVGDFGCGALVVDTDSAARSGGGLWFANVFEAATDSLYLRSSRIVGNTAAGQSSGVQGSSGTATLASNWWDCNDGSGTAQYRLRS